MGVFEQMRAGATRRVLAGAAAAVMAFSPLTGAFAQSATPAPATAPAAAAPAATPAPAPAPTPAPSTITAAPNASTVQVENPYGLKAMWQHADVV
ncbi:MAG: hypothetical protein ACRDAM_12020, partial [Casimicrobium sp.]